MLLAGIKAKLYNRQGESLAEVMVAVLIIAVGLVVLSSLVIASSHLVDKGQTKMTTQYNGESAMESQDSANTDEKIITIKEGSSNVADINVDVYSDSESKLMSYAVK